MIFWCAINACSGLTNAHWKIAGVFSQGGAPADATGSVGDDDPFAQAPAVSEFDSFAMPPADQFSQAPAASEFDGFEATAGAVSILPFDISLIHLLRLLPNEACCAPWISASPRTDFLGPARGHRRRRPVRRRPAAGRRSCANRARACSDVRRRFQEDASRVHYLACVPSLRCAALPSG